MADKKRMPAKLRAKADQAKQRHQKRAIAPDVAVKVTPTGWDYENPYRAADEPAWWALFYEAFGTRHGGVASTFIEHLARLCSWSFDMEKGWQPKEGELQTAISIVQSMKPRNESEAALAAQAVALHFASMKLGRFIGTVTYPDARSVASLAAVSKAYAGTLETNQKLKGRKTARQRITVHHERHVHHHQHVHVEEGGANSGGQSHAPTLGEGSSRIEHGRALSGPDQGGRIVLLPCGSGSPSLPDAWRKVGRSER